MVASATNKIRDVRELCDRSAWPEVHAFAQAWHTESPSDARAFFYQGVALTAMGRYLEAETNYRKALKLDPGDFKTWNNLASLLFQGMHRHADAAQCQTEALKLDPGNKLGWANLASMHGQLGRHHKALEFAERAVALDPQMVEAQLIRARAAQMLGQMDVVRAATEALAKVPPEQFRRTH